MTSIRAKFTKEKNSKYISHLDLMRLFKRAFNRAGVYLEHTEGFNPQPKLAFATALSLGVSSEGEYMDVELINHMDIDELIEKTNSELPLGVRIVKAAYRDGKDSITAITRWGSYIIEAELLESIDSQELESEINKFLNLEDIKVKKEKRKKKEIVTREVDIKEDIKELSIIACDDRKVTFKTMVKTGSNGNLKPELLIEAIIDHTNIKIDEQSMKIHRVELFIEKDDNIITPI